MDIHIFIGLGFNFYAHGFCFYAVYCRVSLHLHVSILLSTRFFFMLICPFLMLSPSFSYAPWRRWDGGSPSISLICPFLMLPPSFSYAPWRRWDGGSPSISTSPSCRRHVSFFMLVCPFLMLSPSFSYAPWRRWDGGSPSISMSPSCCRHVSFLC